MFLAIIHDMDSDDDSLDLMIDYAYAYFLYNRLLLVDVVVDIENEMTLCYPSQSTKLNRVFYLYELTYKCRTNIKIT